MEKDVSLPALVFLIISGIMRRIVLEKGGNRVSRRINILILFLVLALFLCEINFTVADTSYSQWSNERSAKGTVQDQSLSSGADTALVELGTTELVSGPNGSLFEIRSQSKRTAFQRLGIRLLLLIVSVFCILRIALQRLKCRVFLPEQSITSSIILCFIHSKDGKK